MLVLSRKQDQRLVFHVRGIEFSVMVTAIRGDKVRLGVEGPKEVIVTRGELMLTEQERKDGAA